MHSEGCEGQEKNRNLANESSKRGPRLREHRVVLHTPPEIIDDWYCSCGNTTLRCGRGGSDGDLVNNVQHRLQSNLLTCPSGVNMGVRGLSLTPKWQLQGCEGRSRDMAEKMFQSKSAAGNCVKKLEAPVWTRPQVAHNSRCKARLCEWRTVIATLAL